MFGSRLWSDADINTDALLAKWVNLSSNCPYSGGTYHDQVYASQGK